MPKQLTEADLAALYASLPAVPAASASYLKVNTTSGSSTVTVAWQTDTLRTVTELTSGRDGTDTNGSGPWSTVESASATSRTFDKLVPGTNYTFTVTAKYSDSTTGGSVETATITASASTASGSTAPPSGSTTPPSGSTTPPSASGWWDSGVWAMHDSAQATAFGTARGRAVTSTGAFVGREDPTNTWYLNAQYTHAGKPMALGVPMCGPGQTVAQDYSSVIQSIANQLAADGRLFYIRLGWEMNLGSWAWKVTDGNLSTWRSRWSTYYDIFKSTMGNKALVGFNPNGGVDQSGITGTGVMRAWVDGKVDWCGPDQYDCWEGFTNDSNVNAHLTGTGGLNFWATTARNKGVKLALPEWGVSSGTQWAGHTGNDNARYISEIKTWMKANQDIMLFDQYFNESASYLKSDLLSQNPLARARYAQVFGTATP